MQHDVCNWLAERWAESWAWGLNKRAGWIPFGPGISAPKLIYTIYTSAMVSGVRVGKGKMKQLVTNALTVLCRACMLGYVAMLEAPNSCLVSGL